MCLIFTHHKDTVLDAGWIHNFYWHNPDGIGVMFSDTRDDGVPFLNIQKFLPKTEDEAWKVYEEHIKGLECVVHFRMRTHGSVDLTQVHPLVIAEDGPDPVLAFMHNGILSCGNGQDQTKSDTWHFNEYYLKGLLNPLSGGHPDLAFKWEFSHILGDYIGDNNRFVFMDAMGHVEIVNEHTGVYWRGMWLANTYAWDAPSHVFAKRHHKPAEPHDDLQDVAPATPAYCGSYVSDSDWLDYRSYESPKGKGTGKGNLVPSNSTSVVVANNGTGTEKVPLTNDTPFGSRRVAEWMLNQFDSMFDMLKQERCNRSWAKLTYKDFHNFEDRYDCDQLWDAVYMCVDGTITEDRFIDLIKDPSKWDGGSAKNWRKDASDAEVIEATLPRKVTEPAGADEVVDDGKQFPHLTPDIGPDGRPIFNCRTEI